MAGERAQLEGDGEAPVVMDVSDLRYRAFGDTDNTDLPDSGCTYIL